MRPRRTTTSKAIKQKVQVGGQQQQHGTDDEEQMIVIINPPHIEHSLHVVSVSQVRSGQVRSAECRQCAVSAISQKNVNATLTKMNADDEHTTTK